MVCPQCKEDRAHRARRKGLVEHLISIVGYYPHSCHTCKTRFVAYRSRTRARIPSTNPDVEDEIRSTRSVRAWRNRQREIMLYCLAFAVFAAILYFLTHEPRA